MSLKENLNLKIVNITTQHKSKADHLEKNNLNVDNLRKILRKKEFI